MLVGKEAEEVFSFIDVSSVVTQSLSDETTSTLMKMDSVCSSVKVRRSQRIVDILKVCLEKSSFR